MLTIVQRGGATREKPPELVRGQASRLPWVWDKLCFAVPFHEASSQYGLRDIVNNVAPNLQTGTTWTQDNRGNPSVNIGNSGYLQYPDHPQHDRPTTELTAYVRLRRTGTPDIWAGIFCNAYAPESAPDTPWATWMFQQTSDIAGSVQAIITLGTTPTLFSIDQDVIPTTEHVSVFLRWRSGEAPSIRVLGERSSLYWDHTHTSTLTGTLGYNPGQPIRINTSETVTNNYSAIYSQAMAWGRRLSDTELIALVADPFGWYSPRRETIGLSSPYPLVAGAGEMKFGTGSGGLR